MHAGDAGLLKAVPRDYHANMGMTAVIDALRLEVLR